jgi:hypothetical protein
LEQIHAYSLEELGPGEQLHMASLLGAKHDASIMQAVDGEEQAISRRDSFSWYRHVDNFDFDVPSRTSEESATALSQARGNSEVSVSSQPDFQLQDATKTVRDLVTLLSAGGTTTHRVSPAPNEYCTKNDPTLRLDRLGRDIDRLAIAVSEIARASAIDAAQYCPIFVARCDTLIERLERSYSRNARSATQELIARLETILLQFQDIVDPYLECLLCAEAFHASRFPERVTASCNHQVKICSGCLTQWVATAMSERGFAQLKCIECNLPLASEDIRAVASPETFQR